MIPESGWIQAITDGFKYDYDMLTGPVEPIVRSKGQLTYRRITRWFHIFTIMAGKPMVGGYNIAFRRKAFEKAGGFHEDMQISEDIYLSMKMGNRAGFSYDMKAQKSGRRIKKMGYFRLISLYIMNNVFMFPRGKSFKYKKVR